MEFTISNKLPNKGKEENHMKIKFIVFIMTFISITCPQTLWADYLKIVNETLKGVEVKQVPDYASDQCALNKYYIKPSESTVIDMSTLNIDKDGNLSKCHSMYSASKFSIKLYDPQGKVYTALIKYFLSYNDKPEVIVIDDPKKVVSVMDDSDPGVKTEAIVTLSFHSSLASN